MTNQTNRNIWVYRDRKGLVHNYNQKMMGRSKLRTNNTHGPMERKPEMAKSKSVGPGLRGSSSGPGPWDLSKEVESRDYKRP